MTVPGRNSSRPGSGSPGPGGGSHRSGSGHPGSGSGSPGSGNRSPGPGNVSTLGGGGSSGTSSNLSRPNFLFFIADQQRWDHVGYAGNRMLRTPNIDRIASGGSWLSRFYVSSPTCMSDRATFMTGRIPRVKGVRYNGIPLDLDSVTFVDLLLAAGYRTALIGKSHLQGMTSEESKARRGKRIPTVSLRLRMNWRKRGGRPGRGRTTRGR